MLGDLDQGDTIIRPSSKGEIFKQEYRFNDHAVALRCVFLSFEKKSLDHSCADAKQLIVFLIVLFSHFVGSDHLTATWKVATGVAAHIDIKEEKKENAFSLGKSLWIGNEVSLLIW